MPEVLGYNRFELTCEPLCFTNGERSHKPKCSTVYQRRARLVQRVVTLPRARPLRDQVSTEVVRPAPLRLGSFVQRGGSDSR